MADKFRIFISFAIEDKWAKEYLVGQAKNEKSPFEFINMALNEPFDEKWKTQCRSRIKGCDGISYSGIYGFGSGYLRNRSTRSLCLRMSGLERMLGALRAW